MARRLLTLAVIAFGCAAIYGGLWPLFRIWLAMNYGVII